MAVSPHSRLAILLGALVGLYSAGCEEPDPGGSCQTPELTLESTDGCNSCFSCGEGVWGCTELACGLEYPSTGGCFSFPCVSDTDEAPGLQVSCTFEVAGGLLPPCASEGGVATLPPGESACFLTHTDEALSETCAAEGFVLEFEFLFAEDPGPDWWASPNCESPDFLDWVEGEATCHGVGPNGDPNPPG